MRPWLRTSRASRGQRVQKYKYHVLVGARTPEKGATAVQALQSFFQGTQIPGTLEALHIDVTDDETTTRAVEQVRSEHGRLDVLVNNAGIGAVMDPPMMRKQMRDAFDTNATGPAVVTDAFAPLLLRGVNDSEGVDMSPSKLSPRIINISSGAGSIARRLDPGYVHRKLQEVQYRASKAALNMVTACQVVEYGPFGIKVFLYNPGFVVSNLGAQNKAENGAKPVEEAVLPLLEVREGVRDGDAGRYLNQNVGIYPW